MKKYRTSIRAASDSEDSKLAILMDQLKDDFDYALSGFEKLDRTSASSSNEGLMIAEQLNSALSQAIDDIADAISSTEVESSSKLKGRTIQAEDEITGEVTVDDVIHFLRGKGFVMRNQDDIRSAEAIAEYINMCPEAYPDLDTWYSDTKWNCPEDLDILEQY